MKIPHVASIFFVATLALAGCGEEKTPKPAPPLAVERNPLAVTPPPALSASLKTAPVRAIEMRGSLRVPGRIEADDTRITRIGTPVTGRILELDAVVGAEVKRGAILARLTSTDLSNAQLAYLKADSQRLLALRSTQRAQQLFDADVIGTAEVQRRQSELQQAEAEVSAARDQLKVLGMPEAAVQELASTRHVNSQAAVVATLSGTVLERPVTTGQIVQPADTLYTVADLSKVWLVADVPEQHSELVRVGQEVTAEVTALPGKPITGPLVFVAATLNPETRTVRVRLDIANPGRVLKPAMLATVVIRGRPQSVPAVPAAAVVRLENRDHVFVETKPGEYLLRPVTLGLEFDGVRRVQGGLKEGETIVVEGAFQLNVERERAMTQ